MPAKVNSDGRDHYSQVPDTVTYDKNITGEAVRIYSYLSGRRRKDSRWVCAGSRMISKELGLSHVTVIKSVRDLITYKHLERRKPLIPWIKGEKRKAEERGCYKLLSTAFGPVLVLPKPSKSEDSEI